MGSLAACLRACWHYRPVPFSDLRRLPIYLIAIAWIYVVVLMAVVEAVSPGGTWLGAIVTLLLYGVLPLGIVLYLAGSPGRRKRRREDGSVPAAAPDPDGRGHASADAVAPVREEP